MKGIWFFDDWMLERRDCLERVWGRPSFVKEIFTEFTPPGFGYGGFMTAWSIGHTTRLKGAVVGCGVTNLQSFFGTTDIQWFTRHFQRGAPWEAAQRYAAQSPMTFVDRVRTPTLIWHGDEDRRVAVEQGEQLYVSLRERGVPVEFVRYPREGHGLEEYYHQRDMAERALGWMDRYVRGKRR